MRRRKRAKDYRARRMGQTGSKSEEVYQLLDEIPLTAAAQPNAGECERANKNTSLNICSPFKNFCQKAQMFFFILKNISTQSRDKSVENGPRQTLDISAKGQK